MRVGAKAFSIAVGAEGPSNATVRIPRG